MIDKLKAFIEAQHQNLSKQHGEAVTFQIKVQGALEFTENVLKPFIEELEKSESDTVSQEEPAAE